MDCIPDPALRSAAKPSRRASLKSGGSSAQGGPSVGAARSAPRTTPRRRWAPLGAVDANAGPWLSDPGPDSSATKPYCSSDGAQAETDEPRAALLQEQRPPSEAGRTDGHRPCREEAWGGSKRDADEVGSWEGRDARLRPGEARTWGGIFMEEQALDDGGRGQRGGGERHRQEGLQALGRNSVQKHGDADEGGSRGGGDAQLGPGRRRAWGGLLMADRQSAGEGGSREGGGGLHGLGGDPRMPPARRATERRALDFGVQVSLVRVGSG